VNPRLENWLQSALELPGQKGRECGALGFVKVGNIALDLIFPFASLEWTFDLTGFDCLETFVAIVPHTERDAIPGKFVFRRIEVNRYQLFFRRRLSVQSPSGSQPPEVLRSHFELQFGLMARRQRLLLHRVWSEYQDGLGDGFRATATLGALTSNQCKKPKARSTNCGNLARILKRHPDWRHSGD
jgi:hypothetical protein